MEDSGDMIQSGLFDDHAIDLGESGPLDDDAVIRAYLCATGRRFVSLSINQDELTEARLIEAFCKRQMDLALGEKRLRGSTTCLQPLVQRNKALFLNCTLTTFFGDDTALYNMANRLFDDGIEYLGDLVQMVPDHAKAYLKNDRAAMVRLVDQLSWVGLKLGCRVPFWTRPLPSAWVRSLR